MIYSINIIIQVDFTACSGMLQIMIVTLMYILGLGLSTAGAYIACSDWPIAYSRVVALTGCQAQYVDLGYNTICTKKWAFSR